MRTHVAIVDNGGANIASLGFALSRLEATYTVTASAEKIREASHVILPGVGAAADAMQKLSDSRLIDVVRTLQQPVLGICLGMQLLCQSSAESNTECLGVVPGQARRLAASSQQLVPNMGWCRVSQTRGHPLFSGVNDGEWFYFLHSYAMKVDDACIATADHGTAFSAAIAHDNFCATQFHPEKSTTAGARILQNFIGLDS